METEFLHDYENFSNFGSQGSGLNLSGTFFEKVSDHELAFQDDIPQPDYWLSPLDDYGSSSLSPTALSLRGDSCDFSLRDLDHAFDATEFKAEDFNNLDSWNSATDELTGYPDFLSIKQDPDQNFCDSIHDALADSYSRTEFFPTEDESHIDVETVDTTSDALERKSGRQSFQPSVSSPVRSNLAAKPVKPCSLLEKHLRSPIETIINAAQRPNSLNSCTKLNNCRIIRESSIESSTSTKLNARKHKIPIAQAIPGKKHESSSNRMLDAGRTLNRNKLIKLVTTGSSGETILLDHDYCSNNSKSGFISSSSESYETKRVPNKIEPTSIHFFANKLACGKSTNNATNLKETARDSSKIGSGGMPKTEAIDALSTTSLKINKSKSCDTETAFSKDILPGDIVQSSATKSSGKTSVKIEESYCDNKIAQTDVPAKKKSSQKKPVLVSLLNKATVNKDSSKEALCDDSDHEKSSSSKLVELQNFHSSGKTKLSSEKLLTSREANKPNKIIDKERKDNNVSKPLSFEVSSTKQKDKSSTEPYMTDKLNSKKTNTQRGTCMRADKYRNVKKLNRKNKKLHKSAQYVSTSHSKDSLKSANCVNTSSKNNFKSDSNLPFQINSNVISRNTKMADPGQPQRGTLFSHHEKKKEAQISNSASEEELKKSSSRKNRLQPESSINSNRQSASIPPSPSPKNVGELSSTNTKVSHNAESSCTSEVETSTTNSLIGTKVPTESKDMSDSHENKSLSESQCKDNTKQPELNDESKLDMDKFVDAFDAKQDTEEISTTSNNSVEVNAQNQEGFAVTENLALVDMKKDDGHHEKAGRGKKRKLNLSEYRDRQRKRLDPGVLLIAKWEVSPIDLDSSNDPANRRSYKDLLNEIKDLEPKVIETASSGNDVAVLEVEERAENSKTSEESDEHSEMATCIEECMEKKIEEQIPKTDEKNSGKGSEATGKSKKSTSVVEKSNEVQDGVKKNKENNDVKNAKSTKSSSADSKKTSGDRPGTKENNRRGVKKIAQEPSKSSKERNDKRRRSSSSNDSDRSSEHSKKCRSSRSSSASKNSTRRNGRRTPISYRPSSRSSFSSNSSSSSTSTSSRSSSRSRSNSRSRSYGSRSYRYRSDYRRRSRDGDRWSRDHHRYQDWEDRRRSRSRSRHNRRRSKDSRRRSREDRPRSRDNSRRSKNYHRGRSSSSSRKTRSISPIRSEVYRPLVQRNYNISVQDKAIAEGRMIYVGKISRGTTKSDLCDRFEEFGPVLDVSLHLRTTGYSYGFITYKYACDARSAIKHGNDNKSLPEYEIGYGGGRQVCSNSYSDLIELYGLVNLGYSPYDSVSTASPVVYDGASNRKEEEDSFDALLQDFRRAVAERTQKEI
nr:PREDICTED: putative histone-lysine N-methyltransferase 1 isoform X2 [Bemisia tabaci]